MKLKHLYMLGAVALMTASCNEDRFLDLKPQGSLNEDIMTSTEGADLLVNAAYAALGGPRGTELECMVSSYFQLDLW